MGDVLALVALGGAGVYLAMYVAGRRVARENATLKESVQRFRSLTELSADWFWETDAEHRVTWISGGGPVATFFGGTPTYGKQFWTIPGVEVDRAALDALLEDLGKQRAFFDLEIARADERGARQIHIISGHAHVDAHGRFVGYRGVGRDVTEQRRAERALAAAKERLELALGGGNMAEWDFDLDSDEIYLGGGWSAFLGLAPSAGVSRGVELIELVHADDREGIRAALRAAVKGERQTCTAEFRVRTERGDWRWLQATGQVTERDADGRARRASGIVADIDERKRAEQALRETERRYRDVAEVSCEYVWEADAAWRYTYVSERAEAMLGYPRAELLGKRPHDFMPLGESRAVDAWLDQHAPGGRPFRELVHRLITRAGRVMWQSVSAVPLRDAEGRFIGYRGTAADVTPRKQAEARIEFLATRDALTGLPNRVLLVDRGGQAILGAARTRAQLALLSIDLDRFQLVNDSLGHQAGDALLRAVAERLEGLVGGDTLARVGGDEFSLLAPIRSTEEAASRAQRMLDALARPFTVEGRTLSVGASIGIAVYPNDARDFAELLRNAEAARYHAKQSGRGTFRFFSPALHARAVERLQLENELRSALARSELVLHWHPVVRGRRRIVGAEALVRWQHPERGLLMPEDFVPLAEESGLIRALGEWTLERGLSQAGAWQRAHPGRAWVALNVSAAELAQGAAYVERIEAALRAHELPGAALELEVTERVILGAVEENFETLRRLGALGVRIAVDDFGTGYSSLSYLRHLPVQKLKIDRAFLRAIDSHPADEAIVRAIAGLAKTLGIAVAAEGVENEGQLARLLALGCEEWQGHYFSAPLDAAGFEHLLGAEPAQPLAAG